MFSVSFGTPSQAYQAFSFEMWLGVQTPILTRYLMSREVGSQNIYWLVVSTQIEKKSSKWESSPIFRVKIKKYLNCHHLAWHFHELFHPSETHGIFCTCHLRSCDCNCLANQRCPHRVPRLYEQMFHVWKFDPYHPWDWYMYLQEWLIFYGKCR